MDIPLWAQVLVGVIIGWVLSNLTGRWAHRSAGSIAAAHIRGLATDLEDYGGQYVNVDTFRKMLEVSADKIEGKRADEPWPPPGDAPTI